jgi:hypothetical protein
MDRLMFNAPQRVKYNKDHEKEKIFTVHSSRFYTLFRIAALYMFQLSSSQRNYAQKLSGEGK